MTLQLADRSLKYPYGVAEDVIVKTARVLIDVENGKLKVRVQDEEVNFDVFEAMAHLKDDKECFHLDTLDKICMIQEKKASDIFLLEETLVDTCEELYEKEEELINECLDDLKEVPLHKMEEINTEEKVKESKLELKMLPPHLKYAFLEERENKPVIISNSLSPKEEERLVEILKANIGAIGWSISDLKGISPTYCMHKIFMEDDYKLVAQPQRRLNLMIKEEVRKEVLKLLEVGIIYPISDSAWVSLVEVVPKKGGMIVIYNDKNELIPTRNVTGWRICIDYRKLKNATRKDHFPLPFMDQMLERLVGQAFYYFMDGYSGYNKIVVDPKDKEKTTFTCLFGVFAYRKMSFGLCNASATFHRCTQSNLVLNWEKCHFMVTKGIVLGHKISSMGIEVDREKVEVIEKLPPPTNVKGFRSFLGQGTQALWCETQASYTLSSTDKWAS
ncbi:uncharacterized protein LOC128194651 [Vigna angularis]|uniref:uncharacterized protein LOC128194651 n=1 Tax=Phaseolus angularis TaxID=3914 RepID=UPI0022B349F9|nr:uncharacterized protein LOC128194651 [Vigna angularis]